MPGPTATDFVLRADMLDTKVGSNPSTTRPTQGFDALMKGKEEIVAGGCRHGRRARQPRCSPQRQGGHAPVDGEAGIGGRLDATVRA